MIRAAAPAFAVLLLVMADAAAETAPARKFSHDPFDWTALQQAVQKSDTETSASAARAAPQHLPRLRAVMRSPSGDRVNLEGVILGVGDSTEGYRLLEVREYSAVFSRKGTTVEIELGREQTP